MTKWKSTGKRGTPTPPISQRSQLRRRWGPGIKGCTEPFSFFLFFPFFYPHLFIRVQLEWKKELNVPRPINIWASDHTWSSQTAGKLRVLFKRISDNIVSLDLIHVVSPNCDVDSTKKVELAGGCPKKGISASIYRWTGIDQRKREKKRGQQQQQQQTSPNRLWFPPVRSVHHDWAINNQNTSVNTSRGVWRIQPPVARLGSLNCLWHCTRMLRVTQCYSFLIFRFIFHLYKDIFKHAQ